MGIPAGSLFRSFGPCARDGVLLALTYMREQEVVGWTPMEIDGFVESVCCVPEDTEDAVYMIIRREIDGIAAPLTSSACPRD